MGGAEPWVYVRSCRLPGLERGYDRFRAPDSWREPEARPRDFHRYLDPDGEVPGVRPDPEDALGDGDSFE